MPIYPQTYKSWSSRSRRRMRWLSVARHELRVARSGAIYRRLLLLSLLPFLICLFILVVTDLMTTNPSALFRTMIRQVQFTNIDARFFKLYLAMATPFVYTFCLLIGAGAICNDYRHNLLEVYFAKPLTRFEYVAGKLLAVCCVPLLLTVALGLVLFALHVVLAPAAAREFLAQNLWVAPMIAAYSIVLVVPSALLVMGCSAISKTTGWASVIACTVVFVNGAFSAVLAEVFRIPNLRCLSYIRSMVYLSDVIFGGRTRITLHWSYVVAGMLVLALFCLWLVARRVRAVEIAS
ncbi:MAG: hypothetical protein AMXMBFR4_17310 [Candidatus Hydrogenedentota bacterium]